MSQTLWLPNFAQNNIFQDTQAQLTAPAPAASNALTVDNAANFISGFVLLGAIGAETSELLAAGAVTSGTSIPLLSPTVLPHNQYDPVYALFGNQLKVYRATDAGSGQQPPDSAFVLLPGMPIVIDAGNDSTEYTDPSGGGGYWYKYTFFNSTSTSETDLASAVAVRGSFTVNYCSLEQIRRESGFRYARYITDDQIEEMRQAAQDEINGALDEYYQTPFQPPIPSNLKRICIVLAAGYLRSAQYSQISDPQVNGQGQIDWAEIELDKLIMKERVLVNKQGQALDSAGATGGISGYPNQNTATDPASQGGAPRVFRMSDIQGQPMTNANGIPTGNIYYGRKW